MIIIIIIIIIGFSPDGSDKKKKKKQDSLLLISYHNSFSPYKQLKSCLKHRHKEALYLQLMQVSVFNKKRTLNIRGHIFRSLPYNQVTVPS